MREIKIKAWDKRRHEFVEPYNFINGRTGELTLELAHENAFFSIYTGINDKNGQEIYTGHLVRYFDKGLYKLGKVILDRGKFSIIPPWAKDDDYNVDSDAIDLYGVSVSHNSDLEVVSYIFKLLNTVEKQ